MNIRKYPANAGNVGGKRTASGIRYIVIHYTGNDGDTAMNNAKYYAGSVVKTSAHYRAQLQKRAGLTDGTMDYLSAYQYGDDLIRKLATMR